MQTYAKYEVFGYMVIHNDGVQILNCSWSLNFQLNQGEF